jgi:hypothetical protein
MTPDEIKARLDEADTKIAAKLAELGFSPEEIQRQLDPAVPEAIKNGERQTVLARKFQQDLNDPKSGLLDAVLAQAASDLEKRLPEIQAKVEAERRERHMRLVYAGVAAAALAGIAVWYFLIRDTRTSCEKLVGPLAEIEKATGTKVVGDHGHEVGDLCYKYINERGQIGHYIVHIDTDRRTSYPSKLHALERGKYVDTVKFDTPSGPAVLFVAGDAKEISTEELQADVMRRAAVGRRGGDPMGEALANLPPAQHAIVFTAGSRAIRIDLDRKVWTVDAAKAYAAAVAARAK